MLVRMSSSLLISGLGGKAIPGKFDSGLGTGWGDESSVNGGLETACLFFRPEEESPSDLS